MTVTSAEVDYLMQQAGWAWSRLQMTKGAKGMQVLHWIVEEDPRTAYGYTNEAVHKPSVTAKEIYLMDEANRWLGFINDVMTRRVVAMRMPYDDDRGRCVNSYSKIGRSVKTSSDRVRKMHWRGLSIISKELNKNNTLLYKIKLYLPDPTGPNSVTMEFSGQLGAQHG